MINKIFRKGNQSWIFTGRTDAESEAPILWPPDVKNWFIGKDPDAGKDWRQEEKGMREDEMVRWHLQLDGHEFEQTLGVGDGQGNLACCSPWGGKESDMTEWLSTHYFMALDLVITFWLTKTQSKCFRRRIKNHLSQTYLIELATVKHLHNGFGSWLH